MRVWIQTLKGRCTVQAPTIVVLGNKYDLAAKDLQVSEKDVRQLQEDEKGIIFSYVSARSGLNVNETLESMCENLL